MRIETHSAADGEIRHATDSLRAPIAKALAEEEERKRQLEEEMRKRLQKELEEMRRREKEEERRRSEAGSSGSKDDGVRFSISGINPYESLSRDRQAAQPQKKGTRHGAGAGSRVRFCILRSSTWNSFLSDTTKVTPWDSLTSEQQAAYWTNFPKNTPDTFRPYGMMAAASDGLPAGSWICGKKSSGFALLLR